jgi:hypothetical protein
VLIRAGGNRSRSRDCRHDPRGAVLAKRRQPIDHLGSLHCQGHVVIFTGSPGLLYQVCTSSRFDLVSEPG